MSESVVLASRKKSGSWARRIGLLAMVGLIMAGTLASLDAEARRMGGGRSFGRQSNTMQRSTTPPPAQPSQPTQQSAQGAQAQRAQPAPGATPAPNRSRWLGPIAGLAAGLGIAALLSHFGLGEAFAGAMANFIIIALIAMVAIWLIRKFMGRKRDAGTPAYAGGAGSPTLSRIAPVPLVPQLLEVTKFCWLASKPIQLPTILTRSAPAAPIAVGTPVVTA